jgi:toxin ParE1/3/4
MAHTLKLIIAPAAQKDLQEIYQYGLHTWGQAQSAAYLDQLKGSIWALTTQPKTGIERPELAQGLRSLPAKSHILFYRVQPHQLEIARVLHAKQDPARHIK